MMEVTFGTKCILFASSTTLKKKLVANTEFLADAGDPSMSFSVLLQLKTNRTKVILETKLASHPIIVETLTIQ